MLTLFGRTFRALPVQPLVTVALCAAAPAVITAARGGSDFTLALAAASLLAGAGLAYAVTDPAAVTLAASPTSLARRRGVRLALAVAVLAGGWCLAALAAGLGGVALRPLALLALASSGVAVAIAGAAARRSVEDPGLTGAATSVVLVLCLTTMSFRYEWLPRLGDAATDERWLWVALPAWALALWASRDLAARRLVSSSRATLARGGCR